jgi:hypothetical protein
MKMHHLIVLVTHDWLVSTVDYGRGLIIATYI